MQLCYYGCGREGKYFLKHIKKYCCEKNWQSCPVNREKFRISSVNRKHSKETIKRLRNKNIGISNPMFGKKPWNKGLNKENDIRIQKYSKKLVKSCKGRQGPNKFTIEMIREKYPFFSKIEEMRYNPDKPGEKEIQVHCKNHNCLNSKEQGGWFTPTNDQISARIRAIEKPKGFGESNFYCSKECKNICPLYGKKVSQLIKEVEIKQGTYKGSGFQYNQEEYQTFREIVLKRDDYKCVYCGEKAEHVHHTRPQKLEPFFSLDPDFGISVCKECHYKYGHKDECNTGNLANRIC